MLILRVGQVIAYLKNLVEDDEQLADLWLAGEVSNCTYSTAGHVYFTLKDEEGAVKAVLWRSAVIKLPFRLENGMAVIAHGHFSIYEARGDLQFYADTVQPEGLGRLHLEFEALKSRLAAEGLFAPERKRPLPAYPRRIGVVTSPTGAALRDVCNVLGRRYPVVEIVLSPTQVQGEDAPPQIIAALERLAELGRQGQIDLILVVRGGGSLEELWAFNDEGVARTIARMPVPVVTGIGHEVDFTIADFVADVRAPTPSAAAEIATPDVSEIRGALASYRVRLTGAIRDRLHRLRQQLHQEERALRHNSPRAVIDRTRQQLDEWGRDAHFALTHLLTLRRERLNSLARQLQSLSPLNILERGYVIVRRRDDGVPVTRAASVRPGLRLRLQFHDGEVSAESQ